jgi:dihydropteroate synthase
MISVRSLNRALWKPPRNRLAGLPDAYAGQPKTMQEAPKYDDVFADVNRFFIEHIERCERAGIAKEKLLLDPGFGFGKNLSHNYELLARLSEFHHFGLPLLVGMSRKSMIGQLLNVGPSERLSGSLACAVIAAMQGAHYSCP